MEKYLILIAMLLFHAVWYLAYGRDIYYGLKSINLETKNIHIKISTITWSFNIILFPIIYKSHCNAGKYYNVIILAIINMIIHFYVSKLYFVKKKINKKCKNIIHLVQVILVWMIVVLI